VYLYVFGLAAMKITRITCCFDTFFLEKSARPHPVKALLFGSAQTELGHFGKPPANLALLPSRTSNRTCSYPALFELQRRYESMSVVVHNLYCDRSSAQKETSGQNLKVLNRLITIMIYTKHNH